MSDHDFCWVHRNICLVDIDEEWRNSKLEDEILVLPSGMDADELELDTSELASPS
jgi:hypothetical protein